jgi:ATP-dependent exoDNAse (exonuclease V) alpha subunit
MAAFSPHQDAALKAVADWLKAKPGRRGTPQIFRLFGYAGTGKTTLARHVADGVDGKVLYAAFTGKAAQVMRSKGCTGASTIHSLIYKALESDDETPSFELWDDAPASKAKLIVIDECSMVDAELGRDLISFGAPVLVLGDPAQLPPVSGGGFFTNDEPDVMLSEVHRQAQNDPIVRLSMDVRAGRPLAPGQYGVTAVVRREELDPKLVLAADQVLVGRNATRRSYNQRMRLRRGFTSPTPEAGDKLVCLRNNRRKGLFNGSLWSVKERGSTRRRIIKLQLVSDEGAGRAVKVSVRPECFTGDIDQLEWVERKPYDEFDFGYVLTVHKAQGSQWDSVVLFDESFAFSDGRARWLYTGITRAAKQLTVVM